MYIVPRNISVTAETVVWTKTHTEPTGFVQDPNDQSEPVYKRYVIGVEA
jgi:hypothetical protein